MRSTTVVAERPKFRYGSASYLGGLGQVVPSPCGQGFSLKLSFIELW